MISRFKWQAYSGGFSVVHDYPGEFSHYSNAGRIKIDLEADAPKGAQVLEFDGADLNRLIAVLKASAS